MKIYISDVSGFFSEEGFLTLLPLVSETRRKKAEGFLKIEDKIRCIYAEVLLNKVHPDMTNDGFLCDENGKPYIPGGAPFSISHSGKYVVVMVGDGGIDIQEVKPVSEKVIKRTLSAAEMEFLSAAEDKTDAFFKLWTLKEAVVKAVGTGFKLAPYKIECADKRGIRKSIDVNGKQMYLSVFDLDGYKLAACGETVAERYEEIVDLVKIDIADFDKMFEIMEKSFPTDERRPKEEQKELFENPLYTVYCAGEMKAFIAVWEFESFVYVEHFAVSPEYRNEGLGSKMLSALMGMYDKKIVLEVEPPETDVAKGRIGFYERNGFYLNEYPYIQPPISKGKQEVPLMIMTSAMPVSEQEFEEIKNTLYKEVYKTNGSY
ncbi:MAG: GNAT family N-acetyltransferase [Clostridia bacterium]|nr:GNAT family N-acetyltransferase [Clostridia bacterium]